MKSLVDVINSLKGKDISDLSKRARAWAEEGFSWTMLKDRWIETLSRK